MNSPHLTDSGPRLQEVITDLKFQRFPQAVPGARHNGRLHELAAELESDPVQSEHTSGVLPLRQALILAAKLSRTDKKTYDVKKASPICYKAADVGTMLTIAGMPREVVVAGFLHNALSNLPEPDSDSRRKIIEGKFVKKNGLNSEILALIELVRPPGENMLPTPERERREIERVTNNGPKFAALFCAVKSTELLEQHGISPLYVASLDLAFRQHNVPQILRDQFRISASRASPGSDFVTLGLTTETIPAALSPKDVLFIRQGMQLSSKFFAREARNRGIGETVPLNSHSFEVGYLLLTAGADKELVVAGHCHDFEERYVLHANVDKLREFIGKRFGPRVLRLISAVSEPVQDVRTTTNWLERKEAVIEKIKAGASDEATLCCAAKISTFGNGNKWLKACLKAGETDIEKATLGWSKGDHSQNVVYALKLMDVFEDKGVPTPLLEQYEHEIRRFHRFRRMYEQVSA